MPPPLKMNTYKILHVNSEYLDQKGKKEAVSRFGRLTHFVLSSQQL